MLDAEENAGLPRDKARRAVRHFVTRYLDTLAEGRLADSNLTLEAAAQGYGVAMGREPLVSDLLRRGRLVAPLGHDYPTGGVYELLGQPSRSTAGARDRVLDWLAGQLGDSSVSVDGEADRGASQPASGNAPA